jgi:hypothetical protein
MEDRELQRVVIIRDAQPSADRVHRGGQFVDEGNRDESRREIEDQVSARETATTNIGTERSDDCGDRRANIRPDGQSECIFISDLLRRQRSDD